MKNLSCIQKYVVTPRLQNLINILTETSLQALNYFTFILFYFNMMTEIYTSIYCWQVSWLHIYTLKLDCFNVNNILMTVFVFSGKKCQILSILSCKYECEITYIIPYVIPYFSLCDTWILSDVTGEEREKQW